MNPLEFYRRRARTVQIGHEQRQKETLSKTVAKHDEGYHLLIKEAAAIVASAVAEMLPYSSDMCRDEITSGLMSIADSMPLEAVVLAEKPYSSVQIPEVGIAMTYSSTEQSLFPPPTVQVLSQAMAMITATNDRAKAVWSGYEPDIKMYSAILSYPANMVNARIMMVNVIPYLMNTPSVTAELRMMESTVVMMAKLVMLSNTYRKRDTTAKPSTVPVVAMGEGAKNAMSMFKSCFKKVSKMVTISLISNPVAVARSVAREATRLDDNQIMYQDMLITNSPYYDKIKTEDNACVMTKPVQFYTRYTRNDLAEFTNCGGMKKLCLVLSHSPLFTEMSFNPYPNLATAARESEAAKAGPNTMIIGFRV